MLNSDDLILNVSVNEIKKKINLLRKIDLKVTSFEDVFNSVKDLMGGYKIVPFPGRREYVIRAVNDPDELALRNIKRLWYPPPDQRKFFGRAHKIGDAVFYCASSFKTSILEINIKEGDFVALLKCKVKEFYAHGVIGVGLLEDSLFVSPDRTIKWKDYRDNTIRKFFQYRIKNEKFLDDQITKNKLIDEYLSQKFCEPCLSGDYEYKITAAVATLFLNNPVSPSPVLAICYPSVKRDLKAVNWAFTTQAADQYLEPIQFVKFRKAKGLQYDPLYKSETTDDHGNIQWVQHKKSE